MLYILYTCSYSPPLPTPTLNPTLTSLPLFNTPFTGRFSCELSIADELVLTEMIFDGLFNNMSIIQVTALMSAFVHKVSYLILICV